MLTSLELAEKLKPRLATDFQRKLLAASLQSATEIHNPLRLNNFSASFRELFRHVLVELAPDHQVAASMWFVQDATTRGKVTRGQKVAYVVHGGLDPNYVLQDLGIDVDSERGALLKSIDRLSKFTHVNEESFDSSPDDVERQVHEACTALQAFLDCADAARRLLCSRVEERIHDGVVSKAISETIVAIDEIASHHCVEEVDVHDIEVTALDHKEIHFTAYGSVGVELQWGSSSDIRNGDGATATDSFPLTCKFISKVSSPEDLEVIEGSLCVDMSSWWDGYYDDE